MYKQAVLRAKKLLLSKIPEFDVRGDSADFSATRVGMSVGRSLVPEMASPTESIPVAVSMTDIPCAPIAKYEGRFQKSFRDDWGGYWCCFIKPSFTACMTGDWHDMTARTHTKAHMKLPKKSKDHECQ